MKQPLVQIFSQNLAGAYFTLWSVMRCGFPITGVLYMYRIKGNRRRSAIMPILGDRPQTAERSVRWRAVLKPVGN